MVVLMDEALGHTDLAFYIAYTWAAVEAVKLSKFISGESQFSSCGVVCIQKD